MKITKLNDDMKLFKHAFFKVLLGAVAAVPMVTSCYDDSKLWDEIYNINSTISEMKNSLNGQIQAFNDLVAGGNILISECRKMSNGTYAITLSNGTKFNVLQEGKSLEGLVSYLEVDGEKLQMITRRYILDLSTLSFLTPPWALDRAVDTMWPPFPAGSGDGSGEKVSAGWNSG